MIYNYEKGACHTSSDKGMVMILPACVSAISMDGENEMQQFIKYIRRAIYLLSEK